MSPPGRICPGKPGVVPESLASLPFNLLDGFVCMWGEDGAFTEWAEKSWDSLLALGIRICLERE